MGGGGVGDINVSNNPARDMVTLEKTCPILVKHCYEHYIVVIIGLFTYVSHPAIFNTMAHT